MARARRSAFWVAGLFIVATVTSVAALALLSPLTGAEDKAAALAGAPGTVVFSVVMMFVSVAAIVGIPIAFYPVLRGYSVEGALLYLVARMFEGIAYVVGGVFTLGMLNLARAGTPELIPFAQDLSDIAYGVGPTLFFGLGALVLGLLLWGSRLVPRWLSGWKVIGAAMITVQGVLTLANPLDPTLEMVLFMPIAVNEMVFALWLIVKGFDRNALQRLGI